MALIDEVKKVRGHFYALKADGNPSSETTVGITVLMRSMGSVNLTKIRLLRPN